MTTDGTLFSALARAQAKLTGASKDKKNPHFGSKYADLASVWDACREALTSEGICVIQEPCSDNGRVGMVTTLGYLSEQLRSMAMYVTPKDSGPQAAGSCVTYLRRYQLAAMVGVAPEDDDGEAAEGRKQAPWKTPAKPEPSKPLTAAQALSQSKEKAGDDGPKDVTATATPIASAATTAAPVTADTGEAATEEQKSAIKGQLKRLEWKAGFIKLWIAEHFGLVVHDVRLCCEQFSRVQADACYTLLLAHGGPTYDVLLARWKETGSIEDPA